MVPKKETDNYDGNNSIKKNGGDVLLLFLPKIGEFRQPYGLLVLIMLYTKEIKQHSVPVGHKRAKKLSELLV